MLWPYFCRLGLVSISYLSRLEKGRLAASLELTSRLFSSVERYLLARSDKKGGEAGEVVVEALPLAL